MCLKRAMVSIEADACRCNMVDPSSQNITDGIPRLLVKNIIFDQNPGINFNCETSKTIKYVIECNGDDNNAFASSPFSVAIMVLCLFLIFLTIYFFTKWQNGKEKIKDMKRNYEHQIEALKNPNVKEGEVIET
jgi:hypothetical protein